MRATGLFAASSAAVGVGVFLGLALSFSGLIGALITALIVYELLTLALSALPQDIANVIAIAGTLIAGGAIVVVFGMSVAVSTRFFAQSMSAYAPPAVVAGVAVYIAGIIFMVFLLAAMLASAPSLV
jgi:hypothetical protein